MKLTFQFEDFFGDGRQDTEKDAERTNPIFLVESGVVGELKIAGLNDEVLDDDNVRLEVVLHGLMKTELDTSTSEQSECRLHIQKKILSMTQALSLRAHAREVIGSTRVYPFRFDVQSYLQHEQESCRRNLVNATKSDFASIPPSLRHEIRNPPQGVPKPRACARVTYRLSARLFRNQKAIETVHQQIVLLPSHGPSPPTCITDFANEYCPRSKTILRGGLFQKAGNISVIVHEPKRLNIKADSLDSIVQLPVKLRLERTGQLPSSLEQLCVEAEVKWRFRFLTFVSMLEQRGPPTLKQALASAATAHVRSSLSTRSLRMSWRKWKWCNDKNGNSVLESEQPLWLSLPRSDVLTPTFWSPYLSRRYSIWLQVKVVKPGSAKLEVEVPIQVGIETASFEAYEQSLRMSRQSSSDGAFSDAESDELLPRYVA